MSNNRTVGPTRLAAWLKALSNQHRLEIFRRLAAGCEPRATCSVDDESSSCVGELCCTASVAPSTVSHHLKELRGAGLIQMRRQGRRIECSIDREALDGLARFFASLNAAGAKRTPRRAVRKAR